MMKIFLVGNVVFSKRALEKIVDLKAEVVGVATKSKSNFNADHVDLSPICEKENSPYKYVRDINAPHIVEWIEGLQPDIIFVFGWSSLIKEVLLQVPPMGVLGFHPAALPHNRGRHPIIWALALGLDKTASTFFFMDEGADSGDILSQEQIPIHYEDDAHSLYQRICDQAIEQIGVFLPQLQSKKYQRLEQNHEVANYWRKRGRLDGQLDFRMSSKAIYNLTRALTKPYVGVHVLQNEEEVKVWKVSEVDFAKKNFEPGKVLDVQGQKITVKTYDGAICIEEHEFKVLPEINTYL